MQPVPRRVSWPRARSLGRKTTGSPWSLSTSLRLRGTVTQDLRTREVSAAQGQAMAGSGDAFWVTRVAVKGSGTL